MYVTEVREQTAEASNKMIDAVLKECNVEATGVLRLWSDCGPHFRSSENLAHHIELCSARKQTVNCSFLGEQHGKNVLDSAFSVVSLWLNNYAQKRPVHTVKQLVTAMQCGAQDTMRNDPEGPTWKCSLIDFGKFRQQKTNYLRSSDFKITRTYCLLAKPPRLATGACRLQNSVYSDLDPGSACQYDLVQHEHPEPVEWKKSFFEGHKTWEDPPPDIGEVTVLHRRHESQKHKKGDGRLHPVKTFQDRVRAKALRTIKERARVQRKLAALSGDKMASDAKSSDSDSSSSSSSSDSESA